MKDGHIPRGQWPKALVEETLPDSDGVFRQVFVRSANGVFRRDIRQLCLLEEELLIKMNVLSRRELNGRIEIDSVAFWTDSVIVLRYILNE